MAKARYLLAALAAALALAAATPVLWQRAAAEAALRHVDLVLDLPAYRLLAESEGQPPVAVLGRLREAGATAVAVYEETLDQVQATGLAMVRQGRELKQLVAALGRPDPTLARLLDAGQIRDERLYVITADPAVFARLQGALRPRLGDDRVGSPAPGILEVDLPVSQLPFLGIGFRPEEIDLVRRAGLRPVLRPYNVPGAGPDFLPYVLAEMRRLAPDAGHLLSASPTMLGYGVGADGLARVAQELTQRQMLLSLVEAQLAYLPVPGADELARRTGHRVARVLATNQAELEAHPPGAAVNKWVEGVVERNIRVLYLRPFLTQRLPGLGGVETSERTVAALAERLRERGFRLGAPDPLPPVAARPWQLSLMALGAAGALLAAALVCWPGAPPGWTGALFLAGALALAALPVLKPGAGRQAVALATAIAWAALGGACVLARWRLWAAGARQSGSRQTRPPAPGPWWQEAALATLLLVAPALAGGLLVAGLLGDTRYLLEFDYFRGVKVAFVAPLALVAAAHVLGREGLAHWRRSVLGLGRRFMAAARAPLTYGHLLLVAAVAVGLFWYLQRSGNTTLVPLPEWELALRASLERWLGIRPRFKEFLLGWPAIWLGAVALGRGRPLWALPGLFLGVAAAVSVINSFAHARTPWTLALLRTAHGLWLGILLGAAAAFLLQWAWQRWDRRPVGKEPA